MTKSQFEDDFVGVQLSENLVRRRRGVLKVGGAERRARGVC